MSLLEAARNSEFKRLVNGDLSVENAVIIWTNFEGRATKFNPNGGKRTFALVLTEEVAAMLREEGWNVKTRDGRDEGDDPLYFTEIVVNMESQFPPKVVLYTEFRGKKSANKLNERSIKQLDTIEIENVDVVVHPYEHGFSSVATIKGYARAVYVTQGQDSYFGGKYADYEEVPEGRGQLQLGDSGGEFADYQDVTDDDIPFDL